MTTEEEQEVLYVQMRIAGFPRNYIRRCKRLNMGVIALKQRLDRWDNQNFEQWRSEVEAGAFTQPEDDVE